MSSRIHRFPLLVVPALFLALAAPFAAAGAEKPSTAPSQKSAAPLREGKVVSVTNSGIYTYAEVKDTKGKTFWVAAPRFEVKNGDEVAVLAAEHQEEMKSSQLGRTLKDFYGAATLRVNQATVQASSVHGKAMQTTIDLIHKDQEKEGLTKPKAGSIAKAKDGHSIAELYAEVKELEGKEVTLRAQVMSVMTGVQGLDWLRVMDGTGEAGKDLVIVAASKDAPKPGKQAVFRGVLLTADPVPGGTAGTLVIKAKQIQK